MLDILFKSIKPVSVLLMTYPHNFNTIATDILTRPNVYLYLILKQNFVILISIPNSKISQKVMGSFFLVLL